MVNGYDRILTEYLQIASCPGELKGFVSADSAPIARSYSSAFDIWYPWNALKKAGSKGCSRHDEEVQ